MNLQKTLIFHHKSARFTRPGVCVLKPHPIYFIRFFLRGTIARYCFAESWLVLELTHFKFCFCISSLRSFNITSDIHRSHLLHYSAVFDTTPIIWSGLESISQGHITGAAEKYMLYVKTMKFGNVGDLSCSNFYR